MTERGLYKGDADHEEYECVVEPEDIQAEIVKMGSLDVNAPLVWTDEPQKTKKHSGNEGVVVAIVVISLLLATAVIFKLCLSQKNKAVVTINVNQAQYTNMTPDGLPIESKRDKLIEQHKNPQDYETPKNPQDSERGTYYDGMETA